ncbi:MAG: sulfite exporter TauE/SafE family protein [Gemmatimonadales bacterium]
MPIWPVLLASLIGSPHCAAMCGLVAGAAAPTGRTALGYHAARLAGYVALGALAGLAGSGADRLGAAVGMAAVATRGAGILLVAAGVAGLLRAAGMTRIGAVDTHRWLARIATRVRTLRPGARAAALGLLTALLPCGWLLAFVAAAAGTGSAIGGAGAMAVFWLGTVPALVGAGILLQRAAGPLRARLPMVGAVALIVLGLITVFRRPVPHDLAQHQVTTSDHHPR